MKTKWLIPGIAAVGAVAGGLAIAQPPRVLPPIDQYGPSSAPVGPLQIPGEPAPGWITDERAAAWELVMEGVLEASSPEQIRIGRADAPDAVLFVRPETTWIYEGRAVTQDLVPEGAEVRAVFDLDGNERYARRVEAVAPGGEEEALVDPAAPPVASELPGAALEEPPAPVAIPRAPDGPPRFDAPAD